MSQAKSVPIRLHFSHLPRLIEHKFLMRFAWTAAQNGGSEMKARIKVKQHPEIFNRLSSQLFYEHYREQENSQES